MSLDKPPFRVLVLDGGGMRGYYTAVALAAAAKRFSTKGAECAYDVGRAFQLIVGTSTGAILACALAAGYPPTAVVTMYHKHAAEIFANPVPRSVPARLLFALRHLCKPFNDGVALRVALDLMFGDETFGTTYHDRGIALCIPAVDLVLHKPVVFKTPHLPNKHRDNNLRLADACVASGAAPLYLPIAQASLGGFHRAFVDGGLWAYSPILVGLVEALRMSGSSRIEIVSVGTAPTPTGSRPRHDDDRWGMIRWNFGLGILEMAMDAQAKGHAEILTGLLPAFEGRVAIARFHQEPLSPEHDRALGLDRADHEALRLLESLAAADAEKTHSDALKPASSSGFLCDIFHSLGEANRS